MTAHKNECTFRNRHSCNDKQAHHVYLCSNEKTDRRVGGVNFESHTDDMTIKNVISVLEDLDIAPLDFTEAIGHNIFNDAFKGDVIEDFLSDSDSDTEFMWSAHSYFVGGLNSSKLAQIGVELCHQCFRMVCECLFSMHFVCNMWVKNIWRNQNMFGSHGIKTNI